MKHRIFILCLALLGKAALWAQAWSEPMIQAENLDNLKSTETVYFYNVKADAFAINGMEWNTNACATRLTNGDKSVSEVQRCHAFIGNGKVRVRVARYADLFISCLGNDANNIYVDQNQGQYFTYTETAEGSHIYTLNNDTYKKDLDVSWAYGGHLTIVDGAGNTEWAFIKEENVTNGKYMAYKAKRALYGLYQSLAEAGKTELYAEKLAEAYQVYASDEATYAEVIDASKTLFNATYADIAGGVDVSFLFTEADMVGAANAGAWASGGSTFGWGAFENYHSVFKLSQTQTVPQGIYDVMLHAFYREDGSGAAPVLTVQGKTSATAKVPSLLNIDFEMTNANNNNWKEGGKNFIPDGLQSAGQAIAHADATALAQGAVVGADGKLAITTEVKTAEQWFCWGAHRITYQGLGEASLKESLKSVIDEAEALYGEGQGKEADKLKAVLDEAKAVYADENAANHQISIAESELKEAMEAYQWANASVDNPVDVTSLIENNSFERNFDGWTQTGMAAQSNTAFSLKSGNVYVEKWTEKGGKVGDASVTQQVKGLGLGIYILKAAAQNIQEGSTAAQRNAWIVANNTKTEVTGKDEYAVTFVNIENVATIGFLAEGATGNWISADNFRLYYAGGDFADFKKELQRYVETAQGYTSQKMQEAVLTQLNACIADAEAELEKDNADGYIAVSTPLREAVEAAKSSIKAYESLATAIAAAEANHENGGAEGAEKFLAVINSAKAVNENLNSTLEEIAAKISELEKATFEYRIANPSGTVPTVMTDKRYVRGAIAAFGRMTVSGIATTEILEQGFCWSTEPDPTVLDNRTTKYLENNGRMYWMDMEPATVYYMRAYAITKGYAVGYGDVIKMSTLPQGQVTYWYNNGGDAAHNDRINTALTVATTYWSNYTSIRGFNVSCTFSPGTPTADCGYGGGMRIGTNMGQRAGTCMHEMNHGIGGGTLEIWGGWVDSPLRESMNGHWAGDRANEAVRFWENNNNLVITGAYDGGHWGVVNKGETYSQDNIFHNKYPHNGAHLEPGAWAGPKNWNDTEVFYIGNSIINQGFCEDGLIPVNFYSGAFCLPAYVFEQDDHAKYYIKSESADHGLSTAYLIEQNDGTVKWEEMSGNEATSNDRAAWYISFTPDNQYYQFRNAATGRYLTFSANGANGIKTVAKATPAANEDFHLMRGRQDVALGNFKTRGYWIIHPEAKANPATFTATADGKVAANTLNLYNSSIAQRWIFMRAEDINNFETGLCEQALEELDALMAHVRKLRQTSHVEDVPGADDMLIDDLNAIKASAAEATNVDEVHALIKQTRTAAMTFLSKVTPKRLSRPFDLTFLVTNAAIDDNTGWSVKPTFGSSCCEFFQTTFDFNQTIVDLPAGTYKLAAKAFQRPGAYTTAYNAFNNGRDNVKALLYANDSTTKLCHIAIGARTTRLHADDVAVGSPTRYIPNTIASAAAYLQYSTYENEVITTLAECGDDLRIGVKCSSASTGYWTIFDDFRLYYYGTMTYDTVNDIDLIEIDEQTGIGEQEYSTKVYNLQGVKVAETLDGLPQGIYIVNKKKVIVK